MEKQITGTVVEMDISHMRAGILFTYKGERACWDVKVGRIYEEGDEITVYSTEETSLPWYLQGTEFIDEQPISEPEMMRGNIRGTKIA